MKAKCHKYRQTIINAAIDLFGYNESDFDDMTTEEIEEYLTRPQLTEIKEYTSD